MPNTKSAKKALRQSEKRRLLNRARKSMVKTSFNACLHSLESDKGVAAEVALLFRQAQEQIQRAVTKGVLHKNTAARKISRLAKKINAKSNVSK